MHVTIAHLESAGLTRWRRGTFQEGVPYKKKTRWKPIQQLTARDYQRIERHFARKGGRL